MANYVNIASVLFDLPETKSIRNMKKAVLQNTKDTLEKLEGYGLDLVVLSESVESKGQRLEDAETIKDPGPFIRTYMNFAEKEKCYVAGSVKLVEDGKIYNSIIFINSEGFPIGAYHKVNLTIWEIEGGLTPGKNAVVLDTSIGCLGGGICFDLNFEELRKQYCRLKPDIMVFASNYHGGFVQALWAYECRAFFVSALPFLGGGIIDPFGRELAVTDCYTPVAMARVNLDRVMVHLDYNRYKFSDIRKKYREEVIVDIPPNIGSALIYSMTNKRTAMEVAEEFDLELIDDYFARSIKLNANSRR
ncbi:MAG: hypothetical protein UT30_C0022G0009 [Candidatus Uhrbacteria bacterium GW2011_GWF2_39_13]|uniref:CN hydrolase domain-containing protein n=1 Tax=Candidatus Uhrbacteria bacterium GW2011_GWF2_39_13 TaxID=1618995 RepID=A0A0G0MTE1_9BACT|nr:MAG: hypothetical protein UT30_C0022G0009 [Candidatus Uhrbacteria bacterium GW2011_GWF2_39_13]